MERQSRIEEYGHSPMPTETTFMPVYNGGMAGMGKNPLCRSSILNCLKYNAKHITYPEL